MKLLIIDDEAHIRRMMRLTLEPAGYGIDEAATGEEGLVRFGDGRAYDAVLLDQKMPGLDGLATLRRLRERDADARVIVATAFASIELAVDAMRLGAVDFLRKPMTPETLRSAVAAAMAGRPDVPPARRSVGPVAATPVNEPRIQTVTLNGFQILRARKLDPASADHVFLIRHSPDEAVVTVIVAIDAAIAARVERLSHRRLPLDGAFWRQQAERLLAAHLWSEGKPPADGRMCVCDVSREDIERAAAGELD